MILYILAWTAITCATAETQLYPITTEDLKNIVESVRNDVYQHLQSRPYSKRNLKSAPVSNTSNRKSAVIEDIESFLKMMQDSILDNLVKTLGVPSDKSIVHSNKPRNTLVMDNIASVKRDPYRYHRDKDYEFTEDNLKGEPGVDFPDYIHIPNTSFTCSDIDKSIFPVFYGDKDTSCQVFHVCWPNRLESFLCPMGTIFNRTFLACDYWYNTNCSSAASYDVVNEFELNNSLKDRDPMDIMSYISKLYPVEAKIIVDVIHPTMVTSAPVGRSKVDIKSKSGKKNHASKHSHVPQTPEYISTDPQIILLKRRINNYFELLNTIIKRGNSLSDIWKYAEGIPILIKQWLSNYKTSDNINVEPGTELNKYVNVQKKDEKENFILKIIEEHIMNFVDKINNKLRNKELKYNKDEPLEPITLMQFNSRVIVKPLEHKH